MFIGEPKKKTNRIKNLQTYKLIKYISVGLLENKRKRK